MTKEWVPLESATEQARYQGGAAPWKIFRPPVEKCVGHSSKILGPSENSSPPLVSQAGYKLASESFEGLSPTNKIQYI